MSNALLSAEVSSIFNQKNETLAVAVYKYVETAIRYMKISRTAELKDLINDYKFWCRDGGSVTELLNSKQLQAGEVVAIGGYQGETNIELPNGWTSDYSTNPGIAQQIARESVYSTAIFANKKEKNVIITVPILSELTTAISITSLIFVIAPWLVPAPKTEEEKNFFRAVKDGDFATIDRLCNAICEEKGIRKFIAFQKLQTIEKDWIDGSIGSVKAQMNQQQIQIDVHYQQMSDMRKTLSILNENRIALELMKREQQNGVLAKEITNRKEIRVDEFTQGTLFLTVITPLEFWDKDEMQRIIDNRNSQFYSFSKLSQKVLKGLFVDEKGKLMTATSVQISNLGHLDKTSNIYGGYKYEIPQPHIMEYNCWGGFTQHRDAALQRQDLVEALDILIAANKTLTVSDSFVFGRLGLDIMGKFGNIPCIVLPDTEIVTPIQFAEMIIQQEQEEKNGEKN